MKKILLVLGLCLIAALPFTAKAAYFAGNENGTQTVSKEQKVHNAYIAGSTVNVDGDVQKDLYAAGSAVNVNGKTEDDLVAAGNSVNIKGEVGGSAKAAGSTVNIEKPTGEDLMVAANNFTLYEGAKVNEDLLFAANSAVIKGEVGGSLKAVGAKITISGPIHGDVLLKDVDELTITSSAVISGKLTYYSPKTANIESGAQVSQIDYHKIKASRTGWKSFTKSASAGVILYQIIGSIILLLLFIYLLPSLSRDYTEEAFAEVLRNIWWGLIALIIVPIAALIIITLSFKLTAVLGLLYILYLILSSSFVSLLIGAWLVKSYRKAKEYPVTWQSAVIGVIAAAIIALIPIAGPIFLFIFFLISFGALLNLSRGFLNK